MRYAKIFRHKDGKLAETREGPVKQECYEDGHLIHITILWRHVNWSMYTTNKPNERTTVYLEEHSGD